MPFPFPVASLQERKGKEDVDSSIDSSLSVDFSKRVPLLGLNPSAIVSVFIKGRERVYVCVAVQGWNACAFFFRWKAFFCTIFKFIQRVGLVRDWCIRSEMQSITIAWFV